MSTSKKQPPAAIAIHGVAVVLQAILFPATPASVMARAETRVPRRPAAAGAKNQLAKRRKPRGGAPVTGLTARSAATVTRIMQAGASCFAESGYYRASVEDIVVRAGLARGTFYKYFDEKLDLLIAFSDECEDLLFAQAQAFARVPPGEPGHDQRRRWMADYLEFRAQYVGVMRTWIDRSPRDPSLSRARERAIAMVSAALEAWISASPLGHVLDVRAADVMLIGVLERLPDAMADNSRRTRTVQLAELMTTVVERAIYASIPF